MLLFAHLGLTLAAARPVRGAIPFYVLLGSMLPDIIDKPLGELLFGTPAMGRTFAHTILFLLLLCAVAYYRQDPALASLSGGVSAHLLLDFMWNMPSTLLWPLLGPFPPVPYLGTLDYLQHLLRGLSDPLVGMPELLGLCYLVYSGLMYRADISIKLRQVLRRKPMPAPENLR
jgi:membrane-bound metal-dependent hydrolase YbcI (DUF457 family)